MVGTATAAYGPQHLQLFPVQYFPLYNTLQHPTRRYTEQCCSTLNTTPTLPPVGKETDIFPTQGSGSWGLSALGCSPAFAGEVLLCRFQSCETCRIYHLQHVAFICIILYRKLYAQQTVFVVPLAVFVEQLKVFFAHFQRLLLSLLCLLHTVYWLSYNTRGYLR